MPTATIRLYCRPAFFPLFIFIQVFFCSYRITEVKFSWLTPVVHDLGDIPQGKPVVVDFRFRNEGPDPMVIDNIRPACGCTTPDWPREAIAPGDSASVSVTYSARTKGYFYKLIKVYFRGRNTAEKLYVEGYVL